MALAVACCKNPTNKLCSTCICVGDAGVAALASALPSWSFLQQLHLHENYSIGTEGMRSLAAAMASLPALQDLNLSKNQLGQEGARQLAVGLEAAAEAAVKAAAEVEAKAAAAASGKRAAATSCDMDPGMNLGGHFGADAIVGLKGPQARYGSSSSVAAIVKADFGLQVLELGSCKLRAEGVAHIAAALAKINQAAVAAVAEGKAGGSGHSGESSALAGTACMVQKVKYLGLGKNSIGDRGVKVSFKGSREGWWQGIQGRRWQPL